MESIRLTATLPVSPAELYEAWLSGEKHAKMTGAAASSTKRKGGAFTAWDGYISGEHLELEPGRRILQAWRTTEFPKDAPDSLLELRLEPTAEGTRLVLLQGRIPNGQSEMYSEGWQEHYFAPMRKYFSGQKAPAQSGWKAASGRAPKAAGRATKKKKGRSRRSLRATPPAQVGTPAAARRGAKAAAKKRSAGKAKGPTSSRTTTKAASSRAHTSARKKSR